VLPGGLPAPVDQAAHGSVGAALAAGDQLGRTGHSALASAVHDGASVAFFHGFSAANYLAAGVAAAGALIALVLLPAHPTTDAEDAPELRSLDSPATAPAGS
jgi:hypothetical protein